MNMRNNFRGIILFFINHFMAGNYLWKVKSCLIRLSGVSIGHNVKVVAPIKIDICSNVQIGDNCWIGKNLKIIGNADVTIGKNCDFAPDICLVTGNHEIGTYERRAGKGYCEPIHIGEGCWIGVRVTILSGVNVGNGSILAAGSVVNKSVDDNVVVGGVPAKTIKSLNR